MHHSTPGLGLGLYIARKIANAHGGDVTYSPREGGGSVFSISIPLRAD
jgi:signal transduction histidine kinase